MTDEVLASAVEVPAPVHEPMSRATGMGALRAWWAQGLRTAFFLRADWTAVQAGPFVLAMLVLVPMAFDLGVERLYIDGPATFHWQGLLNGWLPMVVNTWLCFWLAQAQPAAGGDRRAPNAVALVSMLAAQWLPMSLLLSLVLVPIARGGATLLLAMGPWSVVLWWWHAGWIVLAQSVVLWRGTAAKRHAKVMAVLLLAAVMGATHSDDTWRTWYPDPPDEPALLEGEGEPLLKLTQDLLELQPALMEERLKALQPQRKQEIDVYAITFAPYAEEDVFRRESQMVADVMAQRFGADGRTIQLVNHRDAAREWPWATPLNLQRVIQQVAQRMDRERDVLFIHMTSHGAQSGELAAGFWPLEVDPVTPEDLKTWLDEAGIRYRLLSISACYSGSWIAPLAGPDTLVMTAADADHTSYGCGSRSELTFFGRAMYDEQLRQTRSFEQAHAQARLVIDQREKEAGKTDGYSNPQIAMGQGMREHLARLEAQLDKSASAR